MKFVDEVIVDVVAGRGGDGCLSFHRGPNVPKGGPDGGNGGDGGAVFVRTHRSLNTLVDYRYKRLIRAKDGQRGGSNNKSGAMGDSVFIDVPCGTTVVDDESFLPLGDLVIPEQVICVAEGGKRGRGNASFRSSIHRTPQTFTQGTLGEQRRLRLQLKVLADVGLLGLPNAGKSTLIKNVSASRPKIADYPFTTLTPNLGVATVGPGESFVIADIPGIIKGASKGHGLGTRFLRHLSRASLLLHLVDVAPLDDSNPVQNVRDIEAELFAFSSAYHEREIWLVLTKLDVLDTKERDTAIADVQAAFPRRVVHGISAVSGLGVNGLLQATYAHVSQSLHTDAANDLTQDSLFEDVLKSSLNDSTFEAHAHTTALDPHDDAHAE